MPDIAPPSRPPGTVQTEVIEEGSPVWRVHGAEFKAHQLNPIRRQTALGGGRFDSLAGDYSYLYFAGDEEGAMAERVFRDLPLDGRPRQVPAVVWEDLLVSELQLTRDLSMVRAHGAALAHLGQDSWLTECEPANYVRTRQWAAAMRGWAPQAEGLVYRCRNDIDRLAAVLSAPIDQHFADCLRVVHTDPLTEPVIFDRLRGVARMHNAVLGRPT